MQSKRRQVPSLQIGIAGFQDGTFVVYTVPDAAGVLGSQCMDPGAHLKDSDVTLLIRSSRNVKLQPCTGTNASNASFFSSDVYAIYIYMYITYIYILYNTCIHIHIHTYNIFSEMRRQQHL